MRIHPVEPVPRSTRGRRTSRSPAPRTRRQGAPGRDAGPRSTWMAVSLTPAGYSSHAAGPCNDKRATAIGAAGVNGHGRTVVTHTGPPVGLTGGIPSWQRLSPICPQRRARHARRAAGFWLPARSPEHQVRPAPIWGSRGRRFKSCQPDRIIAPDLRRRRPTAALSLSRLSQFPTGSEVFGVAVLQSGSGRPCFSRTRATSAAIAGSDM